jgi:hypothetical protein
VSSVASRRLRFIRQSTDADCGVAVAAMLAGVPYREAAGAAGDSPDGMSSGAVVRLLEALTGRPWRWRRCGYPRKLLADADWPGFGAACVRPDEERAGHWVAVAGGRVFDPSLAGPWLLRTYCARGDMRFFRVRLIGTVTPGE